MGPCKYICARSKNSRKNKQKDFYHQIELLLLGMMSFNCILNNFLGLPHSTIGLLPSLWITNLSILAPKVFIIPIHLTGQQFPMNLPTSFPNGVLKGQMWRQQFSCCLLSNLFSCYLRVLAYRLSNQKPL